MKLLKYSFFVLLILMSFPLVLEAGPSIGGNNEYNASDAPNMAYALAYDNESLYVFKDDLTLTHFKDGVATQILGPKDIFTPACTWGISVLAMFNDELYAGGCFSQIQGVAGTEHLAKWDGKKWLAVPGKVQGQVKHLHVNNDGMYVGGKFRSVGNVPGTNLIAKWDGVSWSSVGGGISEGEVVRSIFSNERGLFVGGTLGNVDIEPRSLAVWNNNTWEWISTESLGGGTVADISQLGKDLIIGGQYYKHGDQANYTVAAIQKDGQWEPLGVQPILSSASWFAQAISIKALSSGDVFMAGAGLAVEQDQRFAAFRWNNSRWNPLLSGVVKRIVSTKNKMFFIGYSTDDLGCVLDKAECKFYQVMELDIETRAWARYSL